MKHLVLRCGIITLGCWLGLSLSCFSQLAVVNGTVRDSTQSVLPDVAISVQGSDQGTVTTERGFFQLSLAPGTYDLAFSHLEYTNILRQVTLSAYDTLTLSVTLRPDVRLLEQVEVVANTDDDSRFVPGLVRLDPQTAQNIPSAFQDFNRILVTLPGVVSNNELSSNYSVRGGNYDENLVYVNNIPVYRPFLIRAGQQEGLSFINPDLVADVAFSSGGWQAKYGDKLSSTLNVRYKKPTTTDASLRAGLLGGAAHVEGSYKKGSYIAGVRHKRAQYLLGTLEIDGQYRPQFTDLQSYITYDLDGDENKVKSELGLLVAYANNNYRVQPESRTTTFGTLQESFNLFVGYEGQENLTYQTFQTGLQWTYRINDRWSSRLIGSWVTTQEREYFDLIAGYRLCDVEIGGDFQIDECATIIGLGVNLDHARNKLQANIYNLENRVAYILNESNTLEFGVGVSLEDFQDQLSEYLISDSAGFTTVERAVSNELALDSRRLFGYIQNTTEIGKIHTINYGVRFNYWNVNQQLLISPRVQYAFQPPANKNLVIRASAGLYQQPPFYRELRDRVGNLQTDVKAQSSVHGILGADYRFTMLGREFTLLTELYYKHLYNVNPYDIDNVRIRYFAENTARAYATGIDMRLNGDFIPGAESWFSLGILRTREDVADDGRGYIRRPSDQLVNLGVFFQDHLPNDPTMRVYLSLLYGTGLPFGPPNNDRNRNALNGPDYRRVDLGFSKEIPLNRDKETKLFRSLWIGLEVLNALRANNVISFTWVEDVRDQQFGVPNRLSARFINANVILR
ncbi:TonB-dependent receptor [Tunicatimonas pelagia]|uniref:TonB-dependent receptor n=1 Tax=Tunicatimonas pelagia TaxID=931531 RepID=UPI0026656936|nr:TonB-dependent receptor [Tunicatimonas pelagia]WKN44640.1 TonB-dependent receptor [Tunicatimonas pelagia]